MTNTAKLIIPGLHHPEDEAKKIFDKVGDLTEVEIFGNRVLVAKFVREHVGKGILATSTTQREDRWQGKIGLVLKKGPLAFKDDAANDFCGQDVDVGDWVWFSYGDGTDAEIRQSASADKVECKMLKDVEIHGRVPRPDFIY